MAKDRRLYARFDIGFDEHDKVFPLSDAAFRALVEATLYSRRQLTDGFLAERLALKRWGADVLDELTTNDPEKPSLIRVDGGWQIHDFAEHQTTNADIEAKREAGARAVAKRWANHRNRSPIDDQIRNGRSTLAKTETETDTKTVSSKELTTRTREAFVSVWTCWPKKTEKKKSQEQFERAAKKLGVDVVADHVRRFGEAYAATTESQFVPALAVWLRNERWTDELPSKPDPDAWMVRSMDNMPPWKRPSKADEAWEFVNSLESDGTQGSGHGVGPRKELR